MDSSPFEWLIDISNLTKLKLLNYPQPSAMQVITAYASSSSAQVKMLRIFLDFCLLLYTGNLSENPFGSVLKIYPKSNYISPLWLVLPWPKPPSSLTGINTVMFLPPQPLSTFCSQQNSQSNLSNSLSQQIIHWLRISFTDRPLVWIKGQVLVGTYQRTLPPGFCNVSDLHSSLTPLASLLFLKHINHQA